MALVSGDRERECVGVGVCGEREGSKVQKGSIAPDGAGSNKVQKGSIAPDGAGSRVQIRFK
jgi:hypothetical protein